MKMASDIFVELARHGPVLHGCEDEVYGTMLSQLGFTRAPGAYVLRPEARVILAAHLDTVSGKKPREVRVSGYVAKGIGGMMGADDKAGVALILWLVSLGYSGPQDVGYALFVGEESGCIGATEALDAGVLPNAQVMVSLDRRSTSDIITYQAGQATASQEAGEWLARELGMGHELARGIWTDSAAFAGAIPECLNVSVGYDGAHTDNDTQDLFYLDELAGALAGVAWSDMPVARKPAEVWQVRHAYTPVYRVTRKPKATVYDWQEDEWEDDYVLWEQEADSRMRIRALMARMREWGALEDTMEALLEEYPGALEYVEWLLGER
jgi:hypothetical protein